jgi:hypothetical protein
MDFNIRSIEKLNWYFNSGGDIRPYVFVREDNKTTHPGTRHHLDWFNEEPLYLDPLNLKNLNFAEMIYDIESKAFGPANMATPRWVFYDCAVIPGFVGGFAIRQSKAPDYLKKIVKVFSDQDWIPLSLFIIIPTMAKGQWVAHNLCTVNAQLDKSLQYYGLGFLSKAFSLWYANVESCMGMTQWGSPALKLHSHYGHMKIITSYTPVHTHAKTMTYSVNVSTDNWEKFFTREPDLYFLENYGPTGLVIDPKSEKSMIEVHQLIQAGEGPYYLSAADVSAKKLDEPLMVFKSKKGI